MKIAYIVFNGITWLDLIGIYDPISRLKSMNFLPDLSWDICGLNSSATDNYGLEINTTIQGNSLSGYDTIIVPGGHGTRSLVHDEDFINWVRTAENVPLKVSICTGSLLLGAAGFLKTKKATTHHSELQALSVFCKEVVNQRVVDENDVITAGGVTSGLDLGLYLCRKWAGEQASAEIAERMEYEERWVES